MKIPVGAVVRRKPKEFGPIWCQVYREVNSPPDQTFTVSETYMGLLSFVGLRGFWDENFFDVVNTDLDDFL